ncbi:MAG: response regulator [Planctomycetota bacterium]|nr:MAG: response regulator [Planctomycetota bacterium]
MRLERLSPVHVRAAIALYNKHAWPDGGPVRSRVAPVAAFERARSPEEALALFEREAGSANDACARYALRLGNTRYPFMKLVVQEHLVQGEYFFCVDTHDNLSVRPNAPDYMAWEELKAFNRRLKVAIENEWEQAGLPTFEDLRLLMQEIAEREQAASEQAARELAAACGAAGASAAAPAKPRTRLLIVDDEEQVARGLKALLEARAYEVELAFDGPSALARLAQAPRPDLVLLDCEMPGFDGEEVLRRIRDELGLHGLPVLVATASNIELERLPSACGLLRKPYPRQVLCALLERLARGADPSAPAP